jgi:serine/threonine protein kinase
VPQQRAELQLRLLRALSHGHSTTSQCPSRWGKILAGKYEILELIGVGGIGFVVAANHVELGEKVALKFLVPMR